MLLFLLIKIVLKLLLKFPLKSSIEIGLILSEYLVSTSPIKIEFFKCSYRKELLTLMF